MHRKPSLKKILTVDYAGMVGWLAPLVLWALYLFMLLTNQVTLTDVIFPAVFGTLTLLALGLIVVRVNHYHSIASHGQEVQAVISNIFFYRDRGRVSAIYTFENKKYESGNAIHKVKQTESIRNGDQVTLIVDRNNPRNAYIRDLYHE